MREITAAEAASYAGGVLFCGPADNIAVTVERDSRLTGERSIFVGLPGQKNDGNDFAPAAYANGCRIFLLSSEAMALHLRENHTDASVIFAEDTLKAMQMMAKNYIAGLDLIRVAVTGSVGKTTTKDMMYRIFSSRYRTVCNFENFNNHIGVPLTAFRMEEETEAGIFEMGMNHSGEIHLLADIVRPQTAAVTNIGTSHIGNLGSRENIMKAKMEITDFMDGSSALVYNADNDKLSALKERNVSFRKIPAGKDTDGNAGIRISEIVSLGEKEIEFHLSHKEESCRFVLPLPGIHNAYNAALAAAAGLEYGISLKESARALAGIESNAVRLNVTETHGIQVINDTYNASPDSVRAALDVLTERKARRRVAVLADMFELGDASDEYHRSIGCYAAESGVDLLVAVGQHARHIAAAAAEKMVADRVFYFENSQDFMKRAHEIIRKGDAVLVKGSHGMAMDRVAEFLTETGEWNGL